MELDIPATIILPCLSESAEYASSSVAPGDKLSPTITLDIHATLLKSIRALSQLQKEARALEEGSASGSGSDGLNHDDPALAPPQLWDTERICRWLGDDVGVGEDIVERFRAQRVTGQRLFNLTVRDMREEIGILPFGIRTTIHSAVDLLRRGDPSAVSDPTSLINSGNISGRVGIVPSYSAVAPPPYSRGS
ncbi:hypothetical protein BC829DRAFT_378457 [Chytridium lagenaria]|nr:hypothetical protein BC829DRAFT_378457 [Chytridium lagenaria]